MNTNIHSNSDDPLDLAIAGFRNRTILVFPNPVIAIPSVGPAPKSGDVAASRLSSRRRWLVAASGVCAAATLAIITISSWPKNTWAHVVTAVQHQAWVRLSITAPSNPAAEEPQVVCWFSPEQQIGAARHPGGTWFVELGDQKSQRYDAVEKTIYLTDASSYDEGEFADFAAVLQSFQNKSALVLPDSAGVKLVSQSHKPGKDGDKVWEDFIFEYEDSRRTPVHFRRIFRLMDGAKLPDRMTEEWIQEGKTVSKIMDMDYPLSGPTDIYALDVPRDAKVVDLSSKQDLKGLLKSYSASRKVAIGDYSALALHTVAKSDWKWVNTMYQVRHAASEYSSASSDLEVLMKLSMQIHNGEVKVPDMEADRLEWWKEQSSQMNFSDFEGSTRHQVFVPDQVGYPDIGLPTESARATLEPNPQIGPSQTVMVTVREAKTNQIKDRFWLDPERGFLCVRLEHHPDSGYLQSVKTEGEWIAVTDIDVAEKSESGRWYATQVRQGTVKSSGDELENGMIDGAPYGTSTWRILVDFAK